MFFELATPRLPGGPWAWGAVACAATALVTWVATKQSAPTMVHVETARQVEYRDRIVVQEKEVVRAEYRDRVVTKNRRVTKPDGTVIQTKTATQEVRQRDVSSAERGVARETSASASEKTSQTEAGHIPRYSLGAGYSPVVSGPDAARWVFSGAVRLADTPGWLTLTVAPRTSTSYLNTRVYIGIRVDF